MRIFEKIFVVIIVIALILRFQKLPGDDFLISISLLGIACLNYPLGFAFFNRIKLRNVFKKVSYSGISTLRIIGSVGIGMALAMTSIGILFKLQNWTGADFHLITGLITILLIGIIAFIKFIKSKGEFYIQIFIRIAIIGGIGLILILVY